MTVGWEGNLDCADSKKTYVLLPRGGCGDASILRVRVEKFRDPSALFIAVYSSTPRKSYIVVVFITFDKKLCSVSTNHDCSVSIDLWEGALIASCNSSELNVLEHAYYYLFL